MGKKGESIACPLGVSNKNRCTETKHEGSVVTVAQLAISISQYVNKFIADIETAIQKAGQGQMELIAQINNEGNQELVIQDQDHINNILPQYDNADVDPEVLPNVNSPSLNPVQGSYYKKKKTQRTCQLEEGIPRKVHFIHDLGASHIEWGNRSNWNTNNNKDCCCGVDMVNIVGA
ncbi:hypothetical protein DFH28DRAFT_1085941 [Melampsora americana]|nr:hypothetical protein DFH28DRAFT_1085941 [Melampsora americana]